MRALISACLCLMMLAGAAPQAWAHAQLEGTVPARGATVARQPASVIFRFDEGVEVAFGNVRVYDARAQRVDTEQVGHPSGDSHAVAVGLKPGLPRGTYTATYRVISADGHPVSGGLVFSVGAPSAGPAASVDRLLGAAAAGPVTGVAQSAARAATYLAIALVAGGLAFLLLCWRPALRATGGAEPRWGEAADAVGTRARRMFGAAAALGLIAGLVALVAEGAAAGGTTFWAALTPDVVREVVRTGFGTVVALQLGCWMVVGVGGLLAVPRTAGSLRPAALGAEAQALMSAGRLGWAALGLPAVVLVISPALEGHQVTQHPVWANMALDVFHVAGMAVWLGGLVALLVMVPAATRRLVPRERSAVLAGVLMRYSPIALACVVTIVVTGTIAAILELSSFGDLLRVAYGRAILIKATLVIALCGLGALNRQRVVPQLRRLAGHAAPGGPGLLLRRVVRSEVAIIVVVLAVTGALANYTPPAAGASGPVTVRKPLGPLDLEVTVDPARSGANEVHLYLFARNNGAPFAQTKQMTVTATLPGKIDALPVTLRKSGPGHFTADTVQLLPGVWRFDVTDRVSKFDEYETSLTAAIR